MWIIDNLNNALDTWNEKMAEIWQLLTQSPETFKGGAIWSVVKDINGALQAVGYALLVLFFVSGVVKTCGSFADEFFPSYNVRVVAVNDGVDSDEGDNEFAPFRNVMNEWYAKDVSKKVKMANRIKGSSGLPLSKAPYGYMKDPTNPNRWIIEEGPANVVRNIYTMYLEGMGTEQIASKL